MGSIFAQLNISVIPIPYRPTPRVYVSLSSPMPALAHTHTSCPVSCLYPYSNVYVGQTERSAAEPHMSMTNRWFMQDLIMWSGAGSGQCPFSPTLPPIPPACPILGLCLAIVDITTVLFLPDIGTFINLRSFYLRSAHWFLFQ